MKKTWPVVLSVLAAGALVGCKDDDAADSTSSLGVLSRTDVSGEAMPPANEAAPVDIRKEMTRKAMLGLKFDTGFVTIDEAAAAGVAQRGTYEDALVHFELGRDELYNQNHGTFALGHFRTAILVFPDASEFYDGLGDALLNKKKNPEALAAFRTAGALDPGVVEYQFKIGQVMISLGDRAGAIDQLEHVLSMDADHVDSMQLIARQWYYLNDDAKAWEYVHKVEAMGEQVPPQFRILLANRTPES